jgi:hypothetical protein
MFRDLFGVSWDANRLSTNLSLSIKRLAILKGKRETEVLAQQKKIVQKGLTVGDIALSRVLCESLIRLKGECRAIDRVTLFSELIKARVGLLSSLEQAKPGESRDTPGSIGLGFPEDLVVPVMTVIFASSHVDAEELVLSRKIILAKFEKWFLERRLKDGKVTVDQVAAELADGEVKGWFGVAPPPDELVDGELRGICVENGIKWRKEWGRKVAVVAAAEEAAGPGESQPPPATTTTTSSTTTTSTTTTSTEPVIPPPTCGPVPAPQTSTSIATQTHQEPSSIAAQAAALGALPRAPPPQDQQQQQDQVHDQDQGQLADASAPPVPEDDQDLFERLKLLRTTKK